MKDLYFFGSVRNMRIFCRSCDRSTESRGGGSRPKWCKHDRHWLYSRVKKTCKPVVLCILWGSIVSAARCRILV